MARSRVPAAHRFRGLGTCGLGRASFNTQGSKDHMVTPAKLFLAIIAALLMLGLIFGMAFIPDDTHKFY